MITYTDVLIAHYLRERIHWEENKQGDGPECVVVIELSLS